ncbi:MAG: hypothetical protein Q9178_007865 [Gyalolechia marmorata]
MSEIKLTTTVGNERCSGPDEGDLRGPVKQSSTAVKDPILTVSPRSTCAFTNDFRRGASISIGTLSKPQGLHNGTDSEDISLINFDGIEVTPINSPSATTWGKQSHRLTSAEDPRTKFLDSQSRSQARGSLMACHQGTSLPAPSATRLMELTEDTAAGTSENLIKEDEYDDWLKSQKRGDPRIGRYVAYQSAAVSRVPKPPTRNLPVRHPFCKLCSFKHNETLLRPGVSVEVQDKAFVREVDEAGTASEPRTSFLRIVDIIQDTRSHAVTLRGWIFRRTSCLDGILKKDSNEVCWIMHVDKDDHRDTKVQAMEWVPVDDVIGRRRVRLTNRPFPELSFRDDESGLLESKEVIRDKRVLVCRFKYVCFYTSADRREVNIWSERVLERLRAPDCDKLSAVDDKELRKAWRGETMPGGSHPRSIDLTGEPDPESKSSAPPGARVDKKQPRLTDVGMNTDSPTNHRPLGYILNDSRPTKRPYDTYSATCGSKRHQTDYSRLKFERPPQTVSLLDKMRRKGSFVEAMVPTTKHSSIPKTSRFSTNQYTFNDYFCGAGGMSRAAYQTGLHIQDAFDFDKNACRSYQMNFPHANLHCVWAHEFANLPMHRRVDIAHFSPSCKFFSDCHTRAGKDDEMNTASWTVIGELLTRSKPRVVIVEQTYGLVLRARHQGYLNALIQVFTSRGFSIRWRLLHCADYGLPQMRLRTFMIASCPGEPLPPFPPPTHSSSPETTGLQPWTTLSDTLASIPPNASHHNPQLCRRRAMSRQSGDRVARTITCDGGSQVHPDGTRDYTHRELAALNGFGPEHEFCSKGTKTQIGNAVPPIVGAPVLKSVVESMEKEDGIRRE